MDRTDLKGILQRTAFTVALVVALPGLAWAQSETPNHFTCYEIKPFGFTAIPNVSLVDQFGSTVVTVGRPNKLCAPADKNGEDPTAPTAPDHLTAYQMRNPSIIKVRDQTVTNQFGTFKVDLIKADWLFVPTAKSLVAPPPAAPLDPAVDHFQCYKARRSKGTPQFQKILDVNVEDQFGTGSIDLLRPSHLCAPVDKRGEEPGAETHPFHLLCYKLRARAPFKERRVWLGNQLGPLDDVLLTRRQQFCVPSLKNPITTSSTTTTPATTSSTTTMLAMCPYFGPPITDPSSLPQCAPACGGAHCAPASLVPPGQQSLFASCDSGAGICAPDPIIATADNFVPSSCNSIAGVEGRCLSTCLPFVAAQAAILPTAGCAAGEVCAPCYDPLAADPTAPTGACSLACDQPAEPPVILACPWAGPPVINPASLPQCSPACGGAHCAPASLVPPGQQSLFASCDIGAGICAPDPIITTADNFVPSSCSSIAGVEGRCLSTCLPFVQAQANVLPTDVCASDERCVPCYDPTASDPTAPTGACSFGCDMPLNPPITN